MKRYIFSLFLLSLFLPHQAQALSSCTCQISIVGTPNPAPPASCVVGTVTVAIPETTAGYALASSDIPSPSLPGTVTRNPQSCGPSTGVSGQTQITIPLDSCTAQYTGQIDVSLAVNGLPQTFLGNISGCSKGNQGEAIRSTDIVLDNPLKSNDPMQLIAIVIRAALGVIGTLTLIAFIAGGIMWVTSAGNAERVQQGLHTMLYAAIGVAVIFTAYAVLQFVLRSVGAA